MDEKAWREPPEDKAVRGPTGFWVCPRCSTKNSPLVDQCRKCSLRRPVKPRPDVEAKA